MSSARLSVTFHPDGFFARNPAVGLGQVSGRRLDTSPNERPGRIAAGPSIKASR